MSLSHCGAAWRLSSRSSLRRRHTGAERCEDVLLDQVGRSLRVLDHAAVCMCDVHHPSGRVVYSVAHYRRAVRKKLALRVVNVLCDSRTEGTADQIQCLVSSTSHEHAASPDEKQGCRNFAGNAAQRPKLPLALHRGLEVRREKSRVGFRIMKMPPCCWLRSRMLQLAVAGSASFARRRYGRAQAPPQKDAST